MTLGDFEQIISVKVDSILPAWIQLQVVPWLMKKFFTYIKQILPADVSVGVCLIV